MWKGLISLTIVRKVSGFIRWYTHLLNNPSRVTRMLSLAILVLISFFSILGLFNIADPYPLKGWVYLRLTLNDLGVFGGIIFVLLMAIMSLVTPISLFIMTGSASFGPFIGMLLSYIGIILNANLTFLLVKALSIEHEWGHDRRSLRIKEGIQSNGYPLVLILQLVTFIPFIAINSAAAAAGVKWKDFMKATSMGVLPCIAIFSLLGETIISDFVSPRIYFAFISLLAICIMVVALKKRNTHLRGKRLG